MVIPKVACCALALAALALGGPLPRKVRKMEYPPLAGQAGIQGSVKLHCQIGANGTVRKVTVLDGAPVLADPASANAAKWKFEKPGEESEVVLSYRFELRGATRGKSATEFRFEAPGQVFVIAARPMLTPTAKAH